MSRGWWVCPRMGRGGRCKLLIVSGTLRYLIGVKVVLAKEIDMTVKDASAKGGRFLCWILGCFIGIVLVRQLLLFVGWLLA